ncbi:MAG: tRNA (N6-threonylcarbamoyladenosine(37)-N6)-methyltransferase TrmO [Nanoarchaeota archaeon]|nr:tRNA (N6-threonylcarbamoyladenosine(37)-N6)-methyltransferase TrmO [Nanoarchaeota archaeon]
MKHIGIIHTEFKVKKNTPIQSKFSSSKATITIFSEYEEGLKDLDTFSHVILIFELHESKGYNLLIEPYWGKIKRGIFATRSPNRPNPIGVSIVKLDKIQKNILYVSNVDMLDDTPLLDIKPYIKDFCPKKSTNGWAEGEI